MDEFQAGIDFIPFPDLQEDCVLNQINHNHNRNPNVFDLTADLIPLDFYDE
jgi:hypothetical protein